jgi:hypothetical protein
MNRIESLAVPLLSGRQRNHARCLFLDLISDAIHERDVSINHLVNTRCRPLAGTPERNSR